jgi:hypothetical protein
MHNAVLGGAALADLETKGALDVGNGVAVAQAALPPKRGVKREAQAPLGAAAAGGAAPHATHKRMPSAWPPTPPASLEECLGGCVTRPAFLSLLQRDEKLAWRVEYALQELQQGEQLCQLIDALPDLEHTDYDAALQVPRSAGAGPSGAPPTPPPSPPGSPSPSRTTVDPPSEPPAAEAPPLEMSELRFSQVLLKEEFTIALHKLAITRNIFLNHRGFVLNDDWSLFCFSVSNNLNGLLNHFFDNSFHLSGSSVSRARFFLLGFGFVNTFCTLIFTSFSFFGLSLWFALFFGDFVGMT